MNDDSVRLARDANGKYLTTEAENLRIRVEYLVSLLARLDRYLISTGPIDPGSTAHWEIFIAAGHTQEQWHKHPCPWLGKKTRDAAGLASAEKRIAELEDSLNVIDKDRESYYAPVIAEKDRRIAELEHEAEVVVKEKEA